MDPSFIRALQKIPVQLRERPGARFTVIINGQKKPEGKDWAGVNGANYAINDPPLAGYLAEGHNYGVLCGVAGITVADIDDTVRMEALGITQRIPDTFKVRTGRGGQHAYFDCTEMDHQIGLYDPELKDEDGEPLHLGEIQSKGQQVVGCGSVHPNGNRYELINEAPIQKINKADLLKIFDGLILVGIDDPAEEPRRAEARRRSSGGSSLGDLINIDAVAWPKNIKERHGSELIGAHPLHGSKNGKNFSINTAKNCWHCFHGGHNSGGGPLEWLAVDAGLISCQDAKPGCLKGDIFKKVLNIAREKGFDIPEAKPRANREKESHKEEPSGPTVIDAIKALSGVCDGATSKDGAGFNKFDAKDNKELIDKALSEGTLSSAEEKKAYRFLKKYTKQLKGLGTEYSDIGPMTREGEDTGNGLAEINDRIPQWIEEHHFKTISDTKKIYHYEHGVYLDNGETILEALIESEFSDSTTNKMVADIIGKVKRRTYTDRDLFNNKHVVNVKNGLLDLETLQLLPHTPDYLSTAQMDVLYATEAKSPKIAKFLNEVAQSGDIALIEEIIGWLLWPDYHVHKAVMLVGPGRNGKGTLLRLITAFLGKKSISNVTLQDLVSDTYAKADLYGKLANIGGDLPSKDLSDTAAFRNLTGGDDNRAQEKYRPAFNFRNKAKMIFSANVLPRSQDDTYAFYVRWILIEFLNRFVLDDGTADPNIDEKLQTPEELSGLLNIALVGLKRLKANGWKFSYTKTTEDVERMYKRNANPVFAFLIDECEAGSATDYIEKSVFFDKFNAYVKLHKLRPMSTTKFGELLKDQTEIPVSSFKPWVDYGNRPMCWAGVKFKTPLTKKEENGEKTAKPAEKDGKTGNKTDSVGLQSIPSILKPYSTNPQEEKRIEKENIGVVEIEYKETIDGIDCDPMIAVSVEGDEVSQLQAKYIESNTPSDASEQIRVASLMEWGHNGTVDPVIVACKLHLSKAEVTAWLEANYVRLEKPGGVVRYTQHKAEKGAMA
jgi:P4 family phage/plasmid primase-like protien